MVKCIDCLALDIGLDPMTDLWVHCSIKHAMDNEKLRYRRQPKITKEEAQIERVCEHFVPNDENKSYLFEIAEEIGVE